MKLKKLFCIIMALVIAAALLPSCNRNPGLSETLAPPDDTWHEIPAGETVSEMPEEERNALILSILGEDSAWNGDYNTLTDIQKNLIVSKMAERGYNVKITSDGIVYLSSAPAPTEQEFMEIIKETFGNDFEWTGFSSLTELQLIMLTNALKKAGYSATVTNAGISYYNTKTAPKSKKYYQNPSKSEIDAVVKDVLKDDYSSWNGNLKSIDEPKLNQIIDTFNNAGYNVGVSDDGSRLERLEEPPSETTAVINTGSLNTGSGTTTRPSGGEATTKPSPETTTKPGGPVKSLQQASLFTFGGTGGDRFLNAVALSDGGYVVIGNFQSSNGDYADATGNWTMIRSSVIRFDESGNVVWKRYIGGDGGLELKAAAQLKDGGIVCVGYTTSKVISTLDGNLNITGTKNGVDGIIVKYKQNGDLDWAKIVKGSKGDTFVSVCATPDGDFIVGGKTESSDGDFAGLKDGFIAAVLTRYSADGQTVQWRLAFSGSMFNRIDAVATTPDGYVYAVCNTNSGDLFFSEWAGHGDSDTIVMKISMNGKPIWYKSVYSSGYDEFLGLAVAPDGGCVIAGRFSENRLSEGTFNGIHNYGGTDTAVLKFKPDGVNGEGIIEWITPIGGLGSDIMTGLVAVNGGYVAVGQTASSNQQFAAILNKGELDVFLAYFSESGMLLDMKSVAGSRNDAGLGIATYDGKRVIVVGATRSDDGSFAGKLPKSSGSSNISYVGVFDIKNK
jgi:hypothetical protein